MRTTSNAGQALRIVLDCGTQQPSRPLSYPSRILNRNAYPEPIQQFVPARDVELVGRPRTQGAESERVQRDVQRDQAVLRHPQVKSRASPVPANTPKAKNRMNGRGSFPPVLRREPASSKIHPDAANAPANSSCNALEVHRSNSPVVC